MNWTVGQDMAAKKATVIVAREEKIILSPGFK